MGAGRARGRDCGNARQDERSAGAHPPARGAEAPAGCVLSSRIEQKGPLLSEHRQPGREAGTRGGGGGYVAWPGAGGTPRLPPPAAAKRVSVQSRHTRWQKNAFRCSFGGPIGSETGFGAAHAPPSPASAGFACVFRCKNNGKSNLAPSFWHPNGQSGDSKPRSLAITAPKLVWLPRGSGLLHRNPSGCQAGRDCCTETRLVAVRPAETAPGLARLSVSSSTKLIRGHRRRCRDTGRAGTSAGWSYPPKESRATGQLGMSLFSRLSSKPSASGAR